MKDTLTYEDIKKAMDKINDLPVETFAGFKVVENKYIEPNEVIIMVGSNYMKKLKEEKYKNDFCGYKNNCWT